MYNQESIKKFNNPIKLYKRNYQKRTFSVASFVCLIVVRPSTAAGRTVPVSVASASVPEIFVEGSGAAVFSDPDGAG